MRFNPTPLAGVLLIEMETRRDERGFLERTYCEQEFAARQLNLHWPQCNLTLTRRRGTLRGLHYQADPDSEIKLIRCLTGIIYDVLVDLRPDSLTFRHWQAFELHGNQSQQLYVPAGIAHGFQCLTHDCRVFYQMSAFYYPEAARGIRWNDPLLRIAWPIANPALAPRDQQWPLLDSLV